MGFRAARQRANKKVSEVCSAIGVSDAAVYQWENGQLMPRADKLPKIAEFYGCTVDDLLAPEPKEDG